MNAASRPLPPERSAPRARVLFALGAGVLLAHLTLLSGGFSGLSLDMFTAPGTAAPGEPSPAPPPGSDSANTPPPLELPEPVRTSRVRWIVPKPPEPEPAPPPPPPPPPPPVKKPPPPPEPVVLEPPPPPVEAPAPPPVEAVAEAPEPAPPPPDVPAAAEVPAPEPPAATDVASSTVQGTAAGLAEAGLPPAVPPPGAILRFNATSISKGKTYNGSAQIDWSTQDRLYDAQLVVRVLVFTVRAQTSKGLITDKGLVPDRFTDQGRGSQRAAHFDREGQRLRYSNNAPDAPLLPGAQDWLSVNFQLAALFNARPDAYPEGQTLRLPVTSVTAAELWWFQVGPTTTEKLPAGEVPAIKLTRSPRKEYDKKVEVWLLTGYGHLPGRIRITEPGGDYLDLQLKDLPQFPAGQSNTP